MRISLIIFLTFALSGCSFTPFLYKTDVVQGNIFTDAQISRIQIGMTHAEVERILGSPQLVEPFHNQRSDYVYEYFAGDSRQYYRRGVTIYFNQAGLVERVEKQPLKLEP